METTDPSRRRFVRAVGLGATAGLAGCTSLSDSPDEPTTTRTTTEDGATTDPTGVETTAGEADGTGGDVPTENVVYAFAPDGIAVVDPEAGEVVAEVPGDFEEVSWGDALASSDGRRLFVNDGTNARVVVVDTQAHAMETGIDVGPDPVHMYNPRDGEFWTHSDEEGAFYVVDAAENAVTDLMVAALEDTGHGKLAYHPDLGSKAYATNTNDPGVHVLDVESREATGFVELDGVSGTHAQRYNPSNGLAYFETIGERARIVAVDPADDAVVTSLDFTGHLYNTPDGERLVVTDKGENLVHVVDAATNEVEESIPVEGGPDKIYFHEHDGTTYGFTANTLTPDTAVIDFDELAVVERVPAGDIARPEGAQFFHRGGLTADGWFVTPASGDGVVSIVDADALERHAAVPVPGVETVAYVGTVE